MIALAEALSAQGVSTRAYLSARNRASLVGYHSLSGLAEYVETMTDDGSQGPPGLVTEFLERDLERIPFDVVYASGSRRLARAAGRLRETHGFRAYVTLEETLACGVGSCRGCVIPVRDASGGETYQRVCREGPVFPLEGVRLE
jgi:dihydroorotate dehydrogenase electron transfer subunit